MTYDCPVCEKNIADLISFENLTEQYNSDKVIFCPHCSVGLQLMYEEELDAEGYVHEYWSFRIKTLP